MCKYYDETLKYKNTLKNPQDFNVKNALKVVCNNCGRCTAKQRKKEKKHYLTVNRMLERRRR